MNFQLINSLLKKMNSTLDKLKDFQGIMQFKHFYIEMIDQVKYTYFFYKDLINFCKDQFYYRAS